MFYQKIGGRDDKTKYDFWEEYNEFLSLIEEFIDPRNEFDSEVKEKHTDNFKRTLN
ncbi:MAG: hypothetical protein WAJ93_06095 [Candidatus Nitrosopolaris sp.]